MNFDMIFHWQKTQSQICLTLALTLMCVFQSSDSFAQEINWYPDLNSATQAAAAENKLVLLHFTADWCRPCKTLESFVFSNPAVQRSIKSNVIAVKIDVDRNPDLVQQYAVSKVPYDVALTAAGRIVSKRQSPMNASAFNKMISDYGVIINSLASGSNPGMNQNLDELKELLQNETPKFEGRPTSFTPDAPFHLGPAPSRESAELKRKSEFISNPFINKTTAQTDVSNAVLEIPNPQPTKQTNRFTVTPNFIPNPVPAIDQNQFVPSEVSQLAPADVQQTTHQDTIMPTATSHSVPPESLHATSVPTSIADPTSIQSIAPVSNHFDPNLIEGQLVVASNQTPEKRDRSILEPKQPEASPDVSLEQLQKPDVAEKQEIDQTDKKTEVSKKEPNVVLDDKFFGQPPLKPLDKDPAQGDYQAKITFPEAKQEFSGELAIITPTSKQQGSATAQILITDGPSSPSDAKENDSSFQRPKTKAMPTSSSTELSPPPASGGTIQSGLALAAEKPAPPMFALHGKCPVTLLTESKWVDGDKQWGCVHRNRVYIFANADNLKRFQSDPDGFSPILAGYDPVVFHESGELVDGLEEFGVFMGKANHQRVVLFSTPETRARFQKEPRKYLDTVQQAMKASGASSNLIR